MNPTPSREVRRVPPVSGTSLWRKRQFMVAGACASAWLSGCVLFTSNEEFGLSWSGKLLSQLQQAWGPPTEQQTQIDGSVEIRYDFKQERCTYWFTADKAGKIVAYRYEVGPWGSCKPT